MTAALTSSGAGTLTLTGDNTYTGGTTIAAGTLQIGDGVSGSIVGDVIDNGALVFNRSDNVTYDGIISGTGSVTQAGAGTLIIHQRSRIHWRYDNSGRGAAARRRRFGGSVAGNIVNNGVLVFNRSDTLTLGGRSAAPVRSHNPGAGTVVLTGDNTYTGGTTIAAGTLQLGDGGASGSIVGDVIDNCALVFNRSDAVSFAGNISGIGSVTQAGTGTLTFTARPHLYRRDHDFAPGRCSSAMAAPAAASSATSSTTPRWCSTVRTISTSAAWSAARDRWPSSAPAPPFSPRRNLHRWHHITAGTLQLGDGGTSGSIVGNIANDSALVFNRSDDI